MLRGKVVEVSYMRTLKTITVKVMENEMELFELPDEPVVVLTNEEFLDLSRPQIIEREESEPVVGWDMQMKYEFLVEWCDLCNEPTWYTGHQDIMLSHPHQDHVHLVSPAGKGDILRSGVTYKTRSSVADNRVQVAVIGVM